MASEEHVALIRRLLESGDSSEWNEWRASRQRLDPTHGYISLVDVDLSDADLRGAWSLSHFNLSDANLRGAKLERTLLHSCNLRRADLRDTDLSLADLRRAVLDGANLSGACLEGANLAAASLIDVELVKARLTHANLIGARLQRVNLQGANLSSSMVYGVSAWDVRLDGARQHDLLVTPPGEPPVRVDSLEVSQFIYLMLDRSNLRHIIDTVASKAVLILGRFTPERKAFLDLMANELRAHALVPIIFDFEGPVERDLTETIKVLAGMSLFVIVDVSKAKSTPLELQATLPDFRVPFVVIVQEGEEPFAMLHDLMKFDWVLQPVLTYSSATTLRKAFKSAILDRAWAKHREIRTQKARQLATQSLDEFLGS